MNAIAILLLTLSLFTTALFPPLRLFDRGRRDEKAAEEPAKKETTSRKEERSRKEDRPRKDDAPKKDEPAGAYEVDEFKNIAYRNDKDADPVKHKLDLFLPKGQRDFPVLFFVHGGGWHSGNKELYTALGQMFARNGIGTVVINYRLSPEVEFPAHIQDVAKAFAWTHVNIARYGGRPDRIICCGHSAGGHLVSLLATDEKFLKAEKCSFKDIRCTISISGVYAIDAIYGRYGSVFGHNKADRRDASPLHHVGTELPPFFLLFADKDLPTIEKVSEEFYQALKKAKVDVREQLVPQRTHISIILLMHKDDDPTTVAVFDFIERHTEWKRPTATAKTNGK
jgi:acetyl esterase/lipase